MLIPNSPPPCTSTILGDPATTVKELQAVEQKCHLWFHIPLLLCKQSVLDSGKLNLTRKYPLDFGSCKLCVETIRIAVAIVNGWNDCTCPVWLPNRAETLVERVSPRDVPRERVKAQA